MKTVFEVPSTLTQVVSGLVRGMPAVFGRQVGATGFFDALLTGLQTALHLFQRPKAKTPKRNPMSDEQGSVGTSLLIFLAGAAVGAAVVALTTPKTGAELRGDLKGLGDRVKDRVAKLRADEEGKARLKGCNLTRHSFPVGYTD